MCVCELIGCIPSENSVDLMDDTTFRRSPGSAVWSYSLVGTSSGLPQASFAHRAPANACERLPEHCRTAQRLRSRDPTVRGQSNAVRAG